MQAIAAEIGLSETVFVEPGPPPAVRIFTPTTEVPLAGHPMVGAAWVLRRAGWTLDEAVIRTTVGDITVRADDTGAWVVMAEPRHIRDVAAAPVADLSPLRPDDVALRALGEARGWAGVSAYRVTGREDGITYADVRHFAAPIGISEDPVTGSGGTGRGPRGPKPRGRRGARAHHPAGASHGSSRRGAHTRDGPTGDSHARGDRWTRRPRDDRGSPRGSPRGMTRPRRCVLISGSDATTRPDSGIAVHPPSGDTVMANPGDDRAATMVRAPDTTTS